MTYLNNIACAIKVNGKTLRETKGNNVSKVFIKPNTEYTIFIKNKNPYKIFAHITIDGMDINSNGEKYVIDANNSSEIKRFLLDGNMETGQAFKAVKGENTQNPDNPDMGIVKIEFYRECVYQYTIYNNNYRNTCDYTSSFTTYSSGTHCINFNNTKSLGTEQGQQVNQEYHMDNTYYNLVHDTTVIYKLLEPSITNCNFCYNCGTKLDDKWSFCANCGCQIK